MDLTQHPVGYLSLVVFGVAYLLVIAEEFTHMRKSKPVILAAGIIWAMTALVHSEAGHYDAIDEAITETLIEYAELLLFLLVAMAYVNAMTERNVFAALRSWLIRRRFTFRQLFWITGVLAFFLSPVIDNLTTSLVMCAVVLAVSAGNVRFTSIACVNIVVAANAGGAFSPFGDITTLMVWQQGLVQFHEFFVLIAPSIVNFIIPASIMSFAVPKEIPTSAEDEATLKQGAWAVIVLFAMTLTTAISFHNFLHLPAFLGMMTGLGYLGLFGYFLKTLTGRRNEKYKEYVVGDVPAFDVFRYVARAEWDTLMFFYGVILCVGGLGFLGYLALASDAIYLGIGPTRANILVGLISAVVDNIPVMVAVLNMSPEMSQGQWLLVTLTAGVGGSLLSVGSAAGVALMGQARGQYTFFRHLRWTPVIATGYAASIAVHMWLNAGLF